MKRLHVHVAVEDLEESVRFYSTLFATTPVVLKSDYAKWLLEDPRVNFAISARGADRAGIEHLGIQVEDADELADVYGRLRQADRPVLEEGHTSCCYARSEKSWVRDPAGIPWEVFHTYGDHAVYGGVGPADLPRLAETGAGAGAGAGTGAVQGLVPSALAAASAPAPAAARGCCGPA
ncbi:MAG: hypothetical protein RLY86_2022 [Pseudomonadota bacterium]|jgi:catechol 2,3-dioxygenase-like lactoylglutathione lyase family enzyme